MLPGSSARLVGVLGVDALACSECRERVEEHLDRKRLAGENRLDGVVLEERR
jgi:hypothetical protein